MARKMALVPPDLVSEYYQLNKPEIRLEDKIIQVLHQNEMPDDLRGKLLSQLIPRYQKSTTRSSENYRTTSGII